MRRSIAAKLEAYRAEQERLSSRINEASAQVTELGQRVEALHAEIDADLEVLECWTEAM